MFFRSIKFIIIIACFITLSFSCGESSSKESYYTALLHGCIEDSEIQQLDQLFSFFDQKMKARYGCKTTKESLRHYVFNVGKGDYEPIQISEEERNVIQQYIASPTFEKYWNEFEATPYSKKEFFPNALYKECYVKSDTKISSIFRGMSQSGDISIYSIAYAFMDILENGSKLDPSVGLSIFIYVYLVELVNSQISI